MEKKYYTQEVGDLGNGMKSLTGTKVEISKDDVTKIINEFFDDSEMDNAEESKTLCMDYLMKGKPVTLDETTFIYK